LHSESLDELVAGMVPCMRLYAALGRKFVGESLVSPDSPYAEWLEAYGGDEMEGLAVQLETLLPEVITDAVEENYVEAMRLEREFFAAHA
jgi:thiaminase/transcriptional activator TenA